MILETITYENTHTIQELMEKSVAAYSQRDILRYEREDVIHHVTYEQFNNMSHKIGQYLNEKRSVLGRPLHVGIIGEGSVNYIVALMGAMGSGNVAVPLDHQLSLANLADSLNRADVDILFYDWTHEPLVRDVKAMCPRVTEYFSMQQVQGSPDIEDILNDSRYDGQSWSLNEPCTAPAADDLAMILFTSGTTGKSKGVMLSHHNLVGNALSQSPIENDEFDEIVSVLILPMHHVFCINVDVLAMLYRGGTTCINGKIQLLGKHLHMFEPTVLHIVPMIPKVLYNKIKSIVSTNPGLTDKDALRLVYGRRLGRIICGGGGLPESLAQKYLDMGIRIGQGYGMSECSPVISEPDYEHPEKVSSAGRILDHIEVRVSEQNEIQVRSPFVMKGYYRDPELTQAAFTEDGWLKTGDVGYVDDEGFIYLTGRLKNLIVLSNGENVAPEELEADFGTEPLIRDILVFDEDDMIKCEVHPDYLYAESVGIEDVLGEVQEIVSRHNARFPSFKRIMRTSIRKAPFQKTTSNKIIRSAFFAERTTIQRSAQEITLPENESKKQIYDICVGVLGHKEFGFDTNLYSVGLDSFGSILLLTDLKDRLDFPLTLPELMDHPTVDQLAALMEKTDAAPVPAHQVQDKYPLSSMQTGFVYRMRGNTTANLPYFFKLHNSVDLDRLEDALKELFRIHPILHDRVFKGRDGRYYNHRDDSRQVQIERMFPSAEEWEEKKARLLRPFSYTADETLYHIGLYQTPAGKYLFFDLSHVIGDGESIRILFDDLSQLYLKSPVRKSDYTFYEYILDEQSQIETGAQKQDIALHLKKTQSYEISRSVLAKKDSYDLSTAHNASIRGGFMRIDKESLHGFCAQHGVSENALFLSAFSYTVRLFADLDDVVITSIHNGRTDSRWLRMVGACYVRYLYRSTRVPHQTVEEMLRESADQILQTMKCHTSVLQADEMFVQYQGDLLRIPQIGGEKVEPIRLQLDSLPFHLSIYSSKSGYSYELRYWENRFDREMLKVFLTALEDVLSAIPVESSVRKLKDYLSVSLFPKHLSMEAASFHAALGQKVVDTPDEHTQIKPYILDSSGKKKPYGAWGELYVLNQSVKGNGKAIQSLYTPGVLHDTGIVARITPEKKVEALYQAGRTIKLERPLGQYYVNLFELEQSLKAYPGVEDAQCCVVYGEENLFQIKAVVKASEKPDVNELRQFVAKRLGADAAPDMITFE